MSEIGKLLETHWAGAPLLIWIGGFIALLTLSLGGRTLRIRFKGRDREIFLETDKAHAPKQDPIEKVSKVRARNG